AEDVDRVAHVGGVRGAREAIERGHHRAVAVARGEVVYIPAAMWPRRRLWRDASPGARDTQQQRRAGGDERGARSGRRCSHERAPVAARATTSNDGLTGGLSHPISSRGDAL